jgi:hypothetical protein
MPMAINVATDIAMAMAKVIIMQLLKPKVINSKAAFAQIIKLLHQHSPIGASMDKRSYGACTKRSGPAFLSKLPKLAKICYS